MPNLQYAGPKGLVRFALFRRLISIGSARESDIMLNGIDVAPAHATLTREPGRYRLESTARSNVFFVNGKKSRAHDLRHGDLVVLGGVELSFSTVDLPPEPEDQASEAIQLAAMQRLHDFSRLLTAPADLGGLIDELIDQIVALTGASKGFLVLAKADGYTVQVARNLDRQPVDDPARLLSDDIIRDVITSKRGQIISDALHDTRFQNSLSVINLKLSSVMCAPLLVRGELLGVLYVGNDKIIDLFHPAQLKTLEVFASQAALFIKTAQLMHELRDENDGLHERLELARFGSLIGTCPQMVEVYKRVERVATTDITVLIGGETGTGKELIAHEIHNRSSRADEAFITVNCGAIPENLIESELFGHAKGSFTGAVSNQIGKFQAADKGTIFLDEIGELPLALQVKLLRVIQERKVQRVGDSRSHSVDIRIVAATNRNLLREVKEGRFREDLYFRLNVIGIELPPLRDRGDDVVLIAKYFILRFGEEFGNKLDPETCFDESCVRAMMGFAWPGNIRQLENHIKKALVLADGPKLSSVDLDLDLPDGAESLDSLVPLAEARDLWQRTYINKILALNSGNRTKTARDLGVDPRTIFRHLEKEEKERQQ